MNQQGIYTELTAILQTVFENPDITARPEMSAKDVPEWDSFNHINILVAAEMRFGIKFRASEIDSLRCVGDFANLIAKKSQAA
jgi:acyl carrier protein